MTVDDIFNAAVEGDKNQLKCLLEQEEAKALLNQTITADVEGKEGMVSEFTLAFSVLSNTEGNVPYDLLDMLADAGMSFRKSVVLKQNGETVSRPIIEYAISVWEDPQMVEYLLKKGASPDMVHKVTDAYGKTSTTTMLWYALNYGEEMQMLELLLKYGADPDKCCQIYSEELRVHQYLPPLYYAFVENQDFEKTVCLIRYGASIQCGIDIGVGLMHNTNFRRYISLYQPGMSKLLEQAFEMAKASPSPEKIERQKEENVLSAQSFMEQVQNGTYGHKLKAGSQVTSLRRCYTKAAAYGFANFGFMGLGFGVLAPIIMAKKQPDVILGLMIVGIPCLLIASLIWKSVKKKAKARGQDNVMLQFLGDSILMFAKVLLAMTIILIPLVKAIGSNIEWEDRKTADGGTVTVKRTGDGRYEDAYGKQYVEKE